MMADPQAIRLTFSYDGANVRLESAQRLEMQAFPSDDLTEIEGAAGFWVQLQDDEGRVLYRQVLHNPMGWDREIYPEGKGDNFSRTVVADTPRGTFDVVVPDMPDVRAISVYASVPTPAPAGERKADRGARLAVAALNPAREVAHLPLPGGRGNS